MSPAEKHQQLQKILGEVRSAVVAFSGGVDSTYLLHEAAQVLEKVLAVTVSSPLVPPAEVEEAGRTAARLGVPWEKIALDPLADPDFRRNPPDRCYYCKKLVYEGLWERARAGGFAVVLDGENADDAHVYRPGSRARLELGVRSPLQEAGLTKAEIRELARAAGLEAWDKPSSPCLATRFPYGEEIRPELLARVLEAEEFLRSLGCREVRVRCHGRLARLEVAPADLSRVFEARRAVASFLKELGFLYVALDLEGYRSGSLDAELAFPGV